MNYPNYSFKQSNMDWIIVQNIDQITNVAVQPNQKAWIMVQNEPIFALRTADMMGLCTTEFYKFEKYEPQVPAPAPQYVTIEQFESLKEALNESIAKLEIHTTEQSKPSKRKTDDADA